MRVDRGFLSAYVDRFEVEIDDAAFRSKLENIKLPDLPIDADPAMLLRALQIDFESIYIPSDESLRIGKWIYSLSRGFVAYRYQSPQVYVDICMTPVGCGAKIKESDGTFFLPDTIPIYAIDGLPGAGKSALFRALKRIFPPPMEIPAEGDPPQRIGIISALWVSVHPSFSLKSWIKSTLDDFGIHNASARTIEPLAALLFKTLHRLGVAAILVDELQFASGKTSADRVLKLLLSMREFGVPIIFFANTDLLKTIAMAPAQVSQRIPREKKTFSPLLRSDNTFRKILAAQLSLLPFGHTINLELETKNIYDMVAGSPRGTARLIELASTVTIADRRKLTVSDLIEAKRSPSFDSLRDHIALLSATSPVDSKRYPELASNNDEFDIKGAYKTQLEQQRIGDAAAQAWYASMTNAEREASHAASTEILRNSGKIPPNVKSLGESKRGRKPKITPDELLKNSYVRERLAKFPPRNPNESDKEN